MKKISKDRVIGYIVICIILCTVLTGITMSYSGYFRKTFEEETTVYLDEISSKSSYALRKEIESRLNYLQKLAEDIGNKKTLNIEKELKLLKHKVTDMQCRRIGIADAQGNASATDGYHSYIGNREYFKKAFEGLTTITGSFTERITGNKINICAAPIIKKDHVVAVLYSVYDMESMQNVLYSSSFKGEGYTYIVKKNGDAVVSSQHPDSFGDFENIFYSLRGADVSNASCADQIERDMKNGKNGCIKFQTGVEKYLFYRQLGINDWYLLSVVPETATSQNIQKVLTIINEIFVGVSAIFLILMIYIFEMQAKNRKRLLKLAYLDTLTGIHNQNYFIEKAGELLKKNRQNYAVIKFDVDKFKYVNDLFGYQEGNKALKFLADKLEDHIHSDEICARISGDEFLTLFAYTDERELTQRLDRFIEDVKEYKEMNSSSYELILSIGIYKISNPDMEVSHMIDRAAIPQASVKGVYHSCYAFYNDADRRRILKEKEIENCMKEALKNNEFVVYYQPKYRISDSSLAGAEALVRWQKNERLIPPDEFIPIFEKNGFISKLDRWVYSQVCAKMKEWLGKGIEPVTVSVNVSRANLHNPNFVEDYKNILEESGIPAQYIELEITETAMFEKEESMLKIMDNLHLTGFSLSMDDFGSGYSSLNMLKNIPVDVLKIDREFFNESLNDKKGKQIISLIVGLAKSMGMSIVAEGVETKEQVQFLQSIHCDMAQGYYYARPMPVDGFERILEDE